MSAIEINALGFIGRPSSLVFIDSGRVILRNWQLWSNSCSVDSKGIDLNGSNFKKELSKSNRLE